MFLNMHICLMAWCILLLLLKVMIMGQIFCEQGVSTAAVNIGGRAGHVNASRMHTGSKALENSQSQAT